MWAIVEWTLVLVLWGAMFFAAGAWFGGRRLRIYKSGDPPDPDPNYVDQW